MFVKGSCLSKRGKNANLLAKNSVTNDYDLETLTALGTSQTRFPTLFEMTRIGEWTKFSIFLL